MKQSAQLIRSDKIKDCIFLLFVTQLSFSFYISRLGFYSDDWAFLSVMDASSDQSLMGFFRALSPKIETRPIQGIYISALYYMFQDRPLGYHIVNGVVISLLALIFYLSIYRVTRLRILAVSLPLIYIYLPHYSADRFWVAAFQANLSITFYFLSFYADLGYLSATKSYRWLLWVFGITALVLSLLAYEVVSPLFLVGPLMLWGYTVYRGKTAHSEEDPKIMKTYRVRLMGLLLRNTVLVTAIILFKFRYTTRLQVENGYIGYTLSILRKALTIRYTDMDNGFNFKRAIIVNYIDFLFGIPVVLSKTLFTYRNIWVIGISLIAGAVSGAYIYYLRRQQGMVLTGGMGSIMIFGGIIVFFAGYAIFLTNMNVRFTLTGLANRTAIAAALGVAISLVGCVIWASSMLPTRKLREVVYCFGIAFLVSYSSLMINTMSLFWINAYAQQREIMAKFRQDNPMIVPGSTVLLDGACIYDGPGVIIETDWDMSGILRMAYRTKELNGDVIKRTMQFNEHGILLPIYGQDRFYQYSDNLLIYNYAMRRTFQITNYQQALEYFRLTKDAMNTKCPVGHEGLGVSVF